LVRFWVIYPKEEADYLDVNISSSRTHARESCHYRTRYGVYVFPTIPRVSGDRQERIDHGELIRWTKGFGAPNTEGRDVAAMFRDSLKRHVSFFSPFSNAAIERV